MKTKLSFLLGLALLALPAVAADLPEIAPAVADQAGIEAPSGGCEAEIAPVMVPLPWDDAQLQQALIGGHEANAARQNTAQIGQPTLCPAFQPCQGSDCSGGGGCTYTSIGKRCCYDSSLTRHCCPVGQTVVRAICPCVGTSCSTTTMQTAICQ